MTGSGMGLLCRRPATNCGEGDWSTREGTASLSLYLRLPANQVLCCYPTSKRLGVISGNKQTFRGGFNVPLLTRTIFVKGKKGNRTA